MKRIFLPAFALMIAATPALAENAAMMKYQEDPVYKSIAPDDPHPMEDMIKLANECDARAQYILGDLYAKGKGGLPKNAKKGAEWFEKAARGGYPQAFVRLGALSKRAEDYAGAYKWYMLGAEYAPGAWRTQAQKSADALAERGAIDRDGIFEARKDVNLWKSEVREKAEAKARAEREQQRAEAEKARAEEKAAREKAKADAKAAREKARADEIAAREKQRAEEMAAREKQKAEARAQKEGRKAQTKKDKATPVNATPANGYIKTKKENPYSE
jgi:Sel1 repeat